METLLICPNKEACILRVKEGKIWCETHNLFLTIKNNWENCKDKIPIRHILYIAYSNGINNEILIDEEQ